MSAQPPSDQPLLETMATMRAMRRRIGASSVDGYFLPKSVTASVV